MKNQRVNIMGYHRVCKVRASSSEYFCIFSLSLSHWIAKELWSHKSLKVFSQVIL